MRINFDRFSVNRDVPLPEREQREPDTAHTGLVINCDGENHWDSNGNWVERCPDAGTWPRNEDQAS